MQLRQLHILGAAQSAYRVLTTSPPLPSLTNMSAAFTQQVQTLSSLIAQVETQAATQTAAAGSMTDKTSTSDVTAKELRSGMLVPLRKMAKIISQNGSTTSTGATLSPNFMSALSLPSSTNHQALIAAARAAVTNVTPYKDLFVSNGMPANLLDQINTQITTLTQSIQDTTDAKTQRVGATKNLETLLKQVRDTLHLLDLGVQQACKADPVNGPATRSAWETAKNVRKASVPTDIPWPPTAVSSTVTTTATSSPTASPVLSPSVSTPTTAVASGGQQSTAPQATLQPTSQTSTAHA